MLQTQCTRAVLGRAGTSVVAAHNTDDGSLAGPELVCWICVTAQ